MSRRTDIPLLRDHEFSSSNNALHYFVYSGNPCYCPAPHFPVVPLSRFLASLATGENWLKETIVYPLDIDEASFLE